MNDENAILAYYQGISDGSIVVGKWIRLLYERILDGIEDHSWFYDQRKATMPIKFMERFCHHYKGRMAPQRIKLELFQRAALSCMFGILDGDGFRQFNECDWVMGRKQGKTLIAGGTENYFAYSSAGEYGSEIYFLAPKMAQADLCFSSFKYNVDHEPDLKKRTKSTKEHGLYIQETNTTIQKLPFAEKTSDGFNPMSWVGDEIAAWPGEKGLKQWEVMVSGTGARQEPLGLAIGSAGYEREGLYDEMFRRGTAFLNGNSQEKKILPILYTIDDINKWDDINELRKSLPGLGVTVSVKFILDEIDKAHQSLSKKREFITKYCCIPQSSSCAWLTAQDVAKCFGHNKTLADFRHNYALGGIDLSMAVDLTAAVVVIEKDGISWFDVHFFMPENKIKEATIRDGLPYQLYQERGLLTACGENTVDYHKVHEWFETLEREYEILCLKVGYDRYSAAYLVQDMQADGYDMESVSQGSNLTGVINDVEGMIKDGKLKSAENNNLMKIHMMDSALQRYEDNRRRLVKVSSTAHIDGMAALLDAMCMRRNYYMELEHLLRNERK